MNPNSDLFNYIILAPAPFLLYIWSVPSPYLARETFLRNISFVKH